MMNEVPFVSGVALNAYLTAEDGITKAKATGCTHWYIDGSLEGETPDAWSTERIDAMNARIRELEVRPVYHGNFKAPLASDIDAVRAAAVAHVKTEIELCGKLGASLVVHGGAIVEPRLVAKAKQKALVKYHESLTELTVCAAEHGVELWLENLSNYTKYRPFHYIFTKFEEYRYILDRVPDVKFVLDVGHANIGNPDPLEGFVEYHERIVAMSLSNNDGQKDFHHPLAYGDIDYPRVVRTIVSKGWKGLIVFETRGRDPDKSLNDLAQIYQHCIARPGVDSAEGTLAS